MNRTVAILFSFVYVAGALSACGEEYSANYEHLKPPHPLPVWQLRGV